VLIDEFIEEILVLPDYLDVKVHGAPSLHVCYEEVAMLESGFGGVGGGTCNRRSRPAVLEGSWSELECCG
jgi:hypothetical protein